MVGSAISSGETTDYQTFDVNVHARVINVVPKFQKINQWFSVNEVRLSAPGHIAKLPLEYLRNMERFV